MVSSKYIWLVIFSGIQPKNLEVTSEFINSFYYVFFNEYVHC